jgi:acyl-CoA thioesterase FadM
MATFRARRLVRLGHCDPAGIAYFPSTSTCSTAWSRTSGSRSVTRGDEVMWTCQHVLVAMNMTTGKSQPWPRDIRAALEAFIAAVSNGRRRPPTRRGDQLGVVSKARLPASWPA